MTVSEGILKALEDVAEFLLVGIPAADGIDVQPNNVPAVQRGELEVLAELDIDGRMIRVQNAYGLRLLPFLGLGVLLVVQVPCQQRRMIAETFHGGLCDVNGALDAVFVVDALRVEVFDTQDEHLVVLL